MESATLASQSLSSDVSEFFRAELEAFVATSKRQRPFAWSRVEALQRACRRESPATAVTARPRAVRAGAGGASRRLRGATDPLGRQIPAAQAASSFFSATQPFAWFAAPRGFPGPS